MKRMGEERSRMAAVKKLDRSTAMRVARGRRAPAPLVTMGRPGYSARDMRYVSTDRRPADHR